MRQRLHLLIVNRDERAALAARYGPRWLLPAVECGERVRACPLVAGWCARRDLRADVAGQWLGRVDGHAADWLMVISAPDLPAPHDTSLEWTALDALTGGRSVLDYQTWALRRCLERGPVPSTDGPFGMLDWPERVRAWIANALNAVTLAWTTYRASAYEVVVGFEMPRDRVYFKGLAADRVSEPLVTERFAAVAPDSFARTLTREQRDDGSIWWVMAECKGSPANDPAGVADALARLQCALQSEAQDIPQLATIDLPGLASSRLPQSWTPMDLDPSNVLIDGTQVRFIDLDDSCLGPAPLAMAGFACRCAGDNAAAYRAYEQAWSPPLANLDWRALEDAARACQARFGWTRLLQSVERGELHADLDGLRARVRARLDRQRQRG